MSLKGADSNPAFFPGLMKKENQRFKRMNYNKVKVVKDNNVSPTKEQKTKINMYQVAAII